MRLKLGYLLLAFALVAPAQMKLTVKQLVAFMKSSVELHHDDKKVADYLKNIQLSERLDDRTIEVLIGYGIGPRTARQLEEMRDASKSLPAADRIVESKPRLPDPPSPKEQREVIEQARMQSLDYTAHLPDFICLQVTRRYFDPSGLEFWQPADTITARLSFFDQKEDYKVVTVNNRPTDIPFEELGQRYGGTTTSGEFGTLLKEIFEPDTQATFQWERWATLRGHRMHVYRFVVTQPRSQWTIRYQDMRPIVVGYHGSIFVDRDTNAVMRIDQEVETPNGFPIQEVQAQLDYDYTKIGDQEFLLPLRHTVKSRSGKELTKNEVEFRLYRKFSTDAVIKFDTPDPLPADQTTEQPIQ